MAWAAAWVDASALAHILAEELTLAVVVVVEEEGVLPLAGGRHGLHG
jgi:hypothetical protein